MKTLEIKAAPGVSVPLEDKPRKYIEGGESFSVPDTAYYRRRIADGDLVETAPAKAARARKKAVDSAPAGEAMEGGAA